jgi:hypothetical protein
MEISMINRTSTITTDAPSLILADRIQRLRSNIQHTKAEITSMQQEVYNRLIDVKYMEIDLDSIQKALKAIS